MRRADRAARVLWEEESAAAAESAQSSGTRHRPKIATNNFEDIGKHFLHELRNIAAPWVESEAIYLNIVGSWSVQLH